MKEGFDVKEWTLLRGEQAAGSGAQCCAFPGDACLLTTGAVDSSTFLLP